MSERLSETQMLHLAEIYRDYDCLWNVQSELYKDRFARDAAYQNILERLNIPGLSVKDIPKKIKNLRSSYYQEIKRIQNSKRSGAGQESVYRPKVSWFTTVEGFLKPFRNKRETYSYNDKDSNSASDNEMETQNTKSLEVKNENSEEVLNSVDEPIEVDWELTSPPTVPVQREQNETSTNTYFIMPTKKPTKKGKTDKKDDDIHNAIAKIDKIADSLTKSASSLIEKQEDEFDTFGKYIAMTLRSLPRELAVVGQTDIQKVISDMQLRALRQNSEPALLSYGTATVKLEYP